MLPRPPKVALLAAGLASVSLISSAAGQLRSAATAPAIKQYTGRIMNVDPMRRTVVVLGMFNGIPGAPPVGTANPGTTPGPRDQLAPGSAAVGSPDNPRRDPLEPDAALRNASDLIGSGRTGTAPAREYTYTFKVIEMARITLDGKPVALGVLRPDLFVRVNGRPATGETTASARQTPTGRSNFRPENTGVGGTNTGASEGRNITMMAESIEAFTVRPLNFPPRPDMPQSGPLGGR